MSKEYEVKLMEPIVLKVSLPDGSKFANVDLYEAWRFLSDVADRKPDQEQKWECIRTWLSKKLEVSYEEIAENQARQFSEVVYGIGKVAEDKMRSFVQSIVSSQQPIPESQANTPAGQSS